jgi:hypothetical protein
MLDILKMLYKDYILDTKIMSDMLMMLVAC